MKHIITLMVLLAFLVGNITQVQTIVTNDKLGRVTNIIHENGTEIIYTYDNVGNITAEVILSIL